MNCSAILLAAGKGTRYHGTKQDELFHGKPLWRFAYETAMSVVGEKRIVAVGKDVAGGNTRTESVIIGLKSLPADTDRVIIVEAARPMITKNQVIEILEDPFASSTFVRPLVNTVIYRNATYLNREELYDLLTPQAFDYQLLLQAYDSGRFKDVTDDTRAMYEFHGIKPHFIETESNLFKVTYPGDLNIIEMIYMEQIRKGIRNE